jgi:hypothetical protein
MSEHNQQIELQKKLDEALKKAKGLVQAHWGQERIQGSQISVLKLSIYAPELFQIRAIEEAMTAAETTPVSAVGVDTRDFFHITLPNPYGTIGSLNITKAKALDPASFPHTTCAIESLMDGKQRADRFRLRDVEKAARLAFGHVLTCTANPTNPTSKRISVVIPYTALASFQKNRERITRTISAAIKKQLLPPFKDKICLDVIVPSSSQKTIDIRFNPAYAEEFSKACYASKDRLTPQAIKSALEL